MQHTVLYRDENIRITPRDAMVGAVSYPLDGDSTTLVKPEARRPDKAGALACSAGFGVIAGILFGGNGLVLFGILFVLLGFIAVILMTGNAHAFALIVRSAGFHTAILKSSDEAYLLRIKAAIDEAVNQQRAAERD
jgi:hypothetical protein